MPELADDVRALIDASGAQRVHLVGNDFGAMVAWALAADSPERLVSLTTMSIAHPVATPKAMATSRQALASWTDPRGVSEAEPIRAAATNGSALPPAARRRISV